MKDVQTLNLFEPVEDQIRKHEEAKAEQKRMEEERARRLEEMRKTRLNLLSKEERGV